MSHRARVEAAISREKPDRPPVALWRHFPRDDQTAEGLARATVEFQAAYDFDLVKVTPASGYPAESWGAELEHADNAEGTRNYLKRPVRSPDGWHELETLDVTRGVLGRELEALAAIRKDVGDDVHVLQTIFSPLTIARQLAGDLVLEHIRENSEDLKAGLRTIMETTRRFALHSLDHGADAIFFATQLASYGHLSTEAYRGFGVEYDVPLLESARERTEFVLLHLHGTDPMFGLASAYPVELVNWHDRETTPSLGEGKRLFRKGGVVGGLNRSGALVRGSPEAVRREVEDAIAQTEGVGVIIGAGCVTLTTTPDANIRAAREAVE